MSIENREILTENSIMALICYTHQDDEAMYACWQDDATLRAYNTKSIGDFSSFARDDIDAFPLNTSIYSKELEVIIGAVRLSPDISEPDLAIWVFEPYRAMGYGTKAFALALRYCFNALGLSKVFAGCYDDNAPSMHMLSKLGFERTTEYDEVETNVFSGKEIMQLGYYITPPMLKVI